MGPLKNLPDVGRFFFWIMALDADARRFRQPTILPSLEAVSQYLKTVIPDEPTAGWRDPESRLVPAKLVLEKSGSGEPEVTLWIPARVPLSGTWPG